MLETGQGVKGIIVKENKFLILVKPNGEPDLPGGRVEADEDLVNSLYREISEETGLKVEILDPFAQWSFMKNPGFLISGITYYCKYLAGTVELSPEHSEYNWISLGRIEDQQWKRPFYKTVKQR